jgi:hypothetical protein
MRRTPVVLPIGRAPDWRQAENQQRDPDVDGCVSDIEDEKMTAQRMQIEIVDDSAVRNAIDRIAEGAADNQSKADGW